MNAHLRFSFVSCALLVAPALAQTITVRNPSFEEGEKSPANWTLSGTGDWSEGGADGRRCIVARGNGNTVSVWRNQAITLEPGQTYVLSVQVRRLDGSGGVATIGPPFANFDLHDLTDQWKRYEVIFRTPTNLKPDESYLRLGQWHMSGAVGFDDVKVRVAEGVYRSVYDIPASRMIRLGDGEVLRGGKGANGTSTVCVDQNTEYAFDAFVERRSGNDARVLHEHSAGFNTDRWVFANGKHVTYRHFIGEYSQKDVTVDVSVTYHTAGRLVVEASGNQRDWVTIGEITRVSSASFPVPGTLKYLRDEGIWIRLRAEGERANLQVGRYTYRAKIQVQGAVEGGPERIEQVGATHWLKVIARPARLDLEIKSVGNDAIAEWVGSGKPGLVVEVSNDDPRDAPYQPSITVTSAGRAPVRTMNQPMSADATLWAHSPLSAGENTLLVEVKTKVDSYRAELVLRVPDLDDASFGQRLEIKGDVEAWWCSSGRKIGRHRSLPLNEQRVAAIRLSLAANEFEAAQLVLQPTRTLTRASPLSSDLRSHGGHIIAASNVEILRVEYVSITRPTDRTGFVAEWPDPLPPFKYPADLPAGINHVFWVRVKAPKGTAAGDYQGEVTFQAENLTIKIPLHVHVYAFELPDRLTCSTAFGFSPSNVFKYHRLDKIEDRRAVLEKYWANFAAHHISPYDPAPLDPFKITWPKKDAADLSPTIDWTRWDGAMERALNHYHFNSFMLRVQGLGGGTFHERVDPSLLGFAADSPQYRALMKNYLGQLQSHLKDKGWLDRAFVYWFDEPDPKDYDFVNRGFARLREDAPLLRRMLTEQVEEKLVGGPNIWCPVTPEFNSTKAAPRMAAGEEFWWYVCTGPKAPYATLFIDHPAIELRIWLWQTWQRKISGILVWETNYWTSPTAYPDSLQDPWEDPMSWQTGYGVPRGARRGWGNGDGRFIYPPLATRDRSSKAPILEGPVDSIRWEMLRDGLEDYEYLAILQRLLKDRPDPEAARLLEVPESITKDMTTFTKDPSAIEARRDQIAKTIERLSKP